MSDCRILHGDCIEQMAAMEDHSVDAVVCDPPYEIGFNSNRWDSRGVSFDPATWAAARRVLKPGGHLLAFASARTYHRIAVAIEDSGFDLNNYIEWIYGSGMPHGLNVSKAIDKAEGAVGELIEVREMFDPALTRPGFSGAAHSKVANQKKMVEVRAPATADAKEWEGWNTALKPAHEPIAVARNPSPANVMDTVLAHGTGALNIESARIGDRWPTNVVFSHLPECAGSGPTSPDVLCVPGCPVRDLFEMNSGAPRFFYIAKPKTRERIGGTMRNLHATVKPVELMRYLIRLVTPLGGVVLDPFLGSGSTGCAAMVEGFRFIGIEKEQESFDTALARVSDWAFAYGRDRPTSS